VGIFGGIALYLLPDVQALRVDGFHSGSLFWALESMDIPWSRPLSQAFLMKPIWLLGSVAWLLQTFSI
jgi:hypothetical protein